MALKDPTTAPRRPLSSYTDPAERRVAERLQNLRTRLATADRRGGGERRGQARIAQKARRDPLREYRAADIGAARQAERSEHAAERAMTAGQRAARDAEARRFGRSAMRTARHGYTEAAVDEFAGKLKASALTRPRIATAARGTSLGSMYRAARSGAGAVARGAARGLVEGALPGAVQGASMALFDKAIGGKVKEPIEEVFRRGKQRERGEQVKTERTRVTARR